MVMYRVSRSLLVATERQKKAIATFDDTTPHKKLWSYVYVIRCGEYIKIGKAFNLDNRLNSLQCGNPYELELINAVRIKEALYAEKVIHEVILPEFKHFREWYLLPELEMIKLNTALEKFVEISEEDNSINMVEMVGDGKL